MLTLNLNSLFTTKSSSLILDFHMEFNLEMMLSARFYFTFVKLKRQSIDYYNIFNKENKILET